MSDELQFVARYKPARVLFRIILNSTRDKLKFVGLYFFIANVNPSPTLSMLNAIRSSA